MMISKKEVKATKKIFMMLDKGASEKDCIEVIRTSQGWPGIEPADVLGELAREHYCAKHSTTEEFLD